MEFELNATQYYIKKDSYISVADSKIPYNTSRYDYYKKYENKYRGITVSAKEKNYPLSIGMYDNLSQRPFRVQWDGKVYIDSGEFNGIITAKAGKIGGWEITDDSLMADDIILNSSDSSISGGKLIAADGNMDLIGKFSVYKDISSDYPLGTLGHVQGSLNIYNPETGEDELEHPDGVGLVVNLHENEASKGTSQLLVTERHVALTTGDGSTVGSYLALRPKSFAIGLVGKNAGVAISITRYNEKGEEYENTGKLGIKFNVPAEQQFGIYARFA